MALSSRVLLILLVIVSMPAVHGPASTNLPTSTVGFSATREVPLRVKVVFLGISESELNTTYLTAKINVPSLKPQSVLAGALETGVTYRFSYELSFASSSTVNELVNFLNGIGRMEESTPEPGNFTNPYFENSTTEISSVTNFFYDARLVEGWFNSSQAFGQNPVPGYTLFVADLQNYLPSLTYPQYQNYTTKCPIATAGPRTGQCTIAIRGTATAHYYNLTVVDTDLDYVHTRHFMTAWGGNERFYYLDLSAGPSYWTEELPIQVAAGLRGVDPSSGYSRYWRSTFIANYISGVVYNLFAADQVYPVNYSASYNFHLFVFDNRTADEILAGPRLAETFDSFVIEAEMERLLSFANVTVTTKLANVADNPVLSAVMAKATTTVQDPVFDAPIVDARLVYDWLSENGEGHISQFINRTADSLQYDIPAFIFAFNGSYNFGFTFKEDVILRHHSASIFGVAFGDLVLISHGQEDLNRGDYPPATRDPQPGKGVGFTRTIIHELGHIVGLAHPFSYDVTEDFTDSAMGYYPNSLTFSRFDRDTLLRGINDQLLLFAQVMLANTTSTLFNSGQISAARFAMDSANRKYGDMMYEEAVQDSYDAALNAFAAHELASSGLFGLFSTGLLFGLVGLIIGAGLGLVAGYLVFKRRAKTELHYYRCTTCGSPLRWDPSIARWYCDRCQKPV